MAPDAFFLNHSEMRLIKGQAWFESFREVVGGSVICYLEDLKLWQRLSHNKDINHIFSCYCYITLLIYVNIIVIVIVILICHMTYVMS